MKKNLFLIAALAFALTSCYNDPQLEAVEGNGVHVELLFEHDGIKVYRFFDGGRAHYFTSRGETISTQPSGKASDDETIK
jgi:hypothetical protein